MSTLETAILAFSALGLTLSIAAILWASQFARAPRPNGDAHHAAE